MRGFVIAAALFLLLPASSLAETFSNDWGYLGRRKINCYETECILNPAGAHRFLRPSNVDHRFGVDPKTVRPPGGNELYGPPAHPIFPEGARKTLGPGRPFGLDRPSNVRGGGIIIPRR